MKPDKFVIIQTGMPATVLANETALPACRRNGKPRRRGYGVVFPGPGTCEPLARRSYVATTFDGKTLVWGNQALARAAMLTLMR